jgi:PAS domain S-box-containing protein
MDMDTHVLTAENDQLKRCLDSLSGILAARDAVKDRAPAAIVETLLDSLLAGLDLHIVYLQLLRPVDGMPAEMLKTAKLKGTSVQAVEIGPRLNPCPPRLSIAGQEISTISLPLGSNGEVGFLVAGAARNDFPLNTERLILDVAATNATNALLAAFQAGERRRLDAEAARYKRTLLHQLVDGIAAEVTISTPEGEIVFVNRTCIERTGRPFTGHSDWASSDLLHPDDLPQVKEAWARAVATGGSYEVDVRSRCMDGVYRWVHSHGFPIKDEHGRILQWCTLHLDIDDRKKAEAALADSEHRLDLVTNTIPAMAWSADTAGNVDFFNQHFVDYVGQPLEWLKNGGWRQAVHPQDVDGLLETWKTVMAGDQSGETEARLRRSDGAYRWCLMRVNPLRDQAGKVIRWYGVNSDIEDWRQAKESLRASELMLRSMVDSIAAPLGFFKPTGELEVVNRLVRDYFGTTFDKFSNWENIVHPDDLAESRAAWSRAIETGEAYEHLARIRRADGSYRWNDHRGYPMRDEDGCIVRWCVLQIDIHDRMQAEARLAASERDLNQLINSIPTMTWSASADGKAEFLSQQYLDYVGLPLEEMQGGGWAATLHPDDAQHLVAAWQRMMDSRSGGEVEARVRRYDGVYRWFLFRTNPIHDDSGNVVRWFGVNTDIEDRRRAEEALRASEDALAASEGELNQIVRVIPGLVWSARPDGSATFVNQHYLDYVGLRLEQMLEWGFASVVHPDDLERLAADWQRILASERPGELEARLRRFDGEYRWFLFRGSPVFDAAGKVTKWHGVNTDIEDRKRAEKALRASEAALAASERNLRQIINTIPAVVWSADIDGSADYFNQHYLEYVGYALEQAQGWGWTSAVHPDDLPGLASAWQEVMASGRGKAVEARLRRHDGEYRRFLFRSNALHDEAGNVIKWFGANTDIEELKRAEEAVRASEQNLRRQTETIPQMLWSADPDGAFDYCNMRFLEYTGSAGRGVMGDGWKDAIHPDDREATARAWRHSVATGEPYEVEVRKYCAAAGAYHWCLTTALPLRDEDGRIVKWHGSSVDIHDRKLTEQALKESERKLDQIVNTIPGMAWSANPDGMCDFFNRHHLDYVGLPLEEMRGAGFVKTFHPDDLPQLMGPWQEMLATGRGGEVQGRIRDRNGQYRWFLFRTNPLFDEAGRLIKWFGVNIDIEDSKRAEDKLRKSELNLRQLTETIPQMLWSTDPDGKVEYSNARLQEFMGITAEEFEGHGWADCLHPDDREPTARLWAHCVATGSPYRTEARFCYGGKGSYRWCLTTGLPLRDEDGRIVKWHGACVDLHDWKTAQDELRETQAELAHITRVMTMGQLTASIAHELNQPLSGIMTNAGTGLRMLNADPPNVDGARETARRTIRDANRASEVITRLRALFAKRTTASELVDLNTAVQEVIALSSNELQRSEVSFRVNLTENLPYTMGDRVQLQQVILNFILNGAEAMGAVVGRPKELLISTGIDAAGHVRVSVKDSGVGFDPSLAEKLFSPFYTTKSNGMGIGLSVSRTIVENHQGRLWAEANDGPGATFSFSVPSTLVSMQVTPRPVDAVGNA